MKSILYYLYAFGCYIIFLATFLYLLAFVENLQQLFSELQAIMPKSLDFGTSNFSVVGALALNVLLISLFGLQHSVMARPSFKKKWTKIVPKPIERSTYVLLTSLVLIVLFLAWQPIKTPLWDVSGTLLGKILFWLSFTGWAVVLISTFLINHFDLFGLRQVYRHAKGIAPQKVTFRTPVFYKFMRHPLYFGFLLAFWAAPIITLGHLIFSLGMSIYIMIGIYHEEKDLIALYGETYLDYRKSTPKLLPFFKWRTGQEPLPPTKHLR